MGSGPRPLPHCSAMCSCCVSGISCYCSCDHLPACCPQSSSLPGLPHQPPEPSLPSSPQSQGSKPDPSCLVRLPHAGPGRAFSPAALAGAGAHGLLSPMPQSLLRSGLHWGAGGGLIWPLIFRHSPPLLYFLLSALSPACSSGSPLPSLPLLAPRPSPAEGETNLHLLLVMCLGFSAFPLTFSGERETRESALAPRWGRSSRDAAPSFRFNYQAGDAV